MDRRGGSGESLVYLSWEGKGWHVRQEANERADHA